MNFIKHTMLRNTPALAIVFTLLAILTPPVFAANTEKSLDADGVQILLASAPNGTSLRLGAQDPNLTLTTQTTQRFGFDYKAKATAGQEGGLRFWNIPSTPLNYSSGPAGVTARFHMYASGGQQNFTWKTQTGYLSSPADIKNQEFTVYVRVHELLDPRAAAAVLKIRGGAHSANNPDGGSCTMMTFAPLVASSSQTTSSSKGNRDVTRDITRFGKELTHPLYDYVKLVPAFDASLLDNTWVGLKMLSWSDPKDATRVINQLHIDTTPFDAAGKPANNWRMLSEYIDIEGKSTGRYSKLVNWGGWQTTLRVDGYRSVDFAYPSVREIVAP
jgi:hypothetical protein